MKKNIEITIPNSLHEIELEKYILLLLANEGLDSADEQYEQQILLNTFNYLLGIDEDMLRMIPADDLYVWYKKINKVFEDVNNIDMKSELIKKFTLNGVEYGFIPKLDEISTGEFLDLDTFVDPAFKGEIKHIEALKFMAILYRPVTDSDGELYKIEDYDFKSDRQSFSNMKEAPLDVYLSALNFFFYLRQELLTSSQLYLKEALVREDLKQEVNSLLDGDGTEALIILLKTISQERLILPTFHLRKSLPSFNIIKKMLN